MHSCCGVAALALVIGFGAGGLRPAVAQQLSHPPQRPLPQPVQRPPGDGPAFYADFRQGSDANPGSKDAPWKSVNHALAQMRPGDTLYLRDGVFYENVYLARAGRENAPITLRSYPGEVAIIDGSIAQFTTSPQEMWEPVKAGASQEYRSTRPFMNLRHVLGYFGDSMIALQTYYYAIDLRADNEDLFVRPGGSAPEPVYLGPGIWYDADTGYVHARLSHTHLGMDYPGVQDYRGPTDPRSLPLIIAPFKSVPLMLDGARHVRLQDLTIRGGGFDTVVLQSSEQIELDNVIIYAGTYGLRGRSSGNVRFHNSAIRGGIPPWGALEDGAMREYPGWNMANGRNLARLNTHALFVLEGHTEEQVYYLPVNHDWEFSHSDFTDALDGMYMGGERIRFHHNKVDRVMDDQIYLTPLTNYALGQIFIYQNVFTTINMTFGFGGLGDASKGQTKVGSVPIYDGSIYIFRNIVDQRVGIIPVRRSRDQNGQSIPPKPRHTQSFVIHGRNFNVIGPLHIYHNTFISYFGPAHVMIQDRQRSYASSTLLFTTSDTPRRAFNNLFVYLQGAFVPSPQTLPTPDDDVQIDGNLHYDVTKPADPEFFTAFRASPLFEQSKSRYAPGWEAAAVFADPRFVKFSSDLRAENDYRLQGDSPAQSAGVPLPPEYEDPLRPREGRPDIGALPVGAEMFPYGRDPARLTK